MANFKNFLELGLKAAQDAERRRKEIIEVLTDLDAQVFEATNKIVRIEVRELDPFGFKTLLKNTSQTSSVLMEKSLVAYRPSDQKFEKLAGWSDDKAGYPCKISLDRDKYSCEDRVALEECLGLVLQDPGVGEKLYKLMHSA